jgi:RNA polymerase sigma-70 factor (ECF subfamily)
VASPEQRHELDAALASLGRDLREAILVVEVLGLSYDDGGVLLGIPTGTLKSRVHRARERLLGWMAAGEASGG